MDPWALLKESTILYRLKKIDYIPSLISVQMNTEVIVRNSFVSLVAVSDVSFSSILSPLPLIIFTSLRWTCRVDVEYYKYDGLVQKSAHKLQFYRDKLLRFSNKSAVKGVVRRLHKMIPFTSRITSLSWQHKLLCGTPVKRRDVC